MNYEVVELKEKLTVGISARTNNASPDMGSLIGGLWGRFYEDGIYGQIAEKINDKALGIYSDYENDEKGDYSITVACEVKDDEEIPDDAVVKVIPGGQYAKFVVKGHMQLAVAEFWEKLWEMNLDRAFTCDFEEYQNSSVEQAEIHIYIALKSS